MKKRYLFLMATTALLSGNAFCADRSGTCGTGCTWEVNGSELVITGTGENAAVDYNDVHGSVPPSQFPSNATSVRFEGNITRIGKHAFLDSNLTSVTIPNSVTEIEDGAFQGSKLTSLIIPSSVTSIGSLAFGDNNLSSVMIEGTPTIGSSAFRFSRRGGVAYCLEGYTACEDIGANDVSYYHKEKGNYVLSDGTVIGTYPYKEPKRIYTIEEARAVVKAIGKDHVRFRIRYK